MYIDYLTQFAVLGVFQQTLAYIQSIRHFLSLQVNEYSNLLFLN